MHRETLMKTILFLLTLYLFSGCSSIQVQTDYDPKIDLKPLNTFVVLQRTQKDIDTLTDDRITRALKEVFASKHYVNVKQKEADFFVIYHVDVQNKTRIDTDYQRMGIYPYGYGGVMIATTRPVDYEEGRLIIDIMNPKTKKIIWRGMAVDHIKTLKTPQERDAYIKKAVERILETFPDNV
jgi:hypothetical protein